MYSIGDTDIKEMYKKIIPFLVDKDDKKKQCFIAQKEGKFGIVDDMNKVLHTFMYDDIFIYEEVAFLCFTSIFDDVKCELHRRRKM